MKKQILLIALCAASTLQAQFNTPWVPANNNTLQQGYIGVGTSTNPFNNPLPNFNVQIHGTSDFIAPALECCDPSGMILNYGDSEEATSMNKSSLNYGKTARLGITNSFSGRGLNDGTVLRMSKNDFQIANREKGRLSIAVPGVSLHFLSNVNRITTSGIPAVSASDKFAKFNIGGEDNGLSIITTGNHYAMRLKVATNNNYLIRGFGINDNEANFAVKGDGYVYARRYITTLNPFPDYVFEKDYELRSFKELKTFIQTNKHLPNMPTAKEVAENGADIGEINRVLVEKVEELTLYILQLEERLKTLEDE